MKQIVVFTDYVQDAEKMMYELKEMLDGSTNIISSINRDRRELKTSQTSTRFFGKNMRTLDGMRCDALYSKGGATDIQKLMLYRSSKSKELNSLKEVAHYILDEEPSKQVQEGDGMAECKYSKKIHCSEKNDMCEECACQMAVDGYKERLFKALEERVKQEDKKNAGTNNRMR